MTRNADGLPPTGILGGTFDPVHKGHLQAARQLLLKASLLEVWLMPNADPPHRLTPTLASPKERLRMVELAVAGVEGLRACALEVERGGTSYTADTLAQLGRAFPGRPFTLLLGFDAALQIRLWHRAEVLLREASFVIFSRPQVDFSAGEMERLGFPAERTRVIGIETPPISARTVRERLRLGKSVEGMLEPAVIDFISEHGLYPAAGGMG